MDINNSNDLASLGAEAKKNLDRQLRSFAVAAKKIPERRESEGYISKYLDWRRNLVITQAGDLKIIDTNMFKAEDEEEIEDFRDFLKKAETVRNMLT